MFWIIRKGASVSQLRQLRALPRGARTTREVSPMRRWVMGSLSRRRRSHCSLADAATDGTGGADHFGCNFEYKIPGGGAAIEVCASFGNSARVSALFEAELSECSMGGNLCGLSTGEALSRWCAAVIGNNALSDFASAPTWVQNGTPNFVDQTAPTDQDAVSTGCGMAFLSWMQSLGHTLSEICPAMVALTEGGTFAQLYGQLTTDSAANAFPTLLAAVQALPNGVNDDDPFAGAANPGPAMHLDPHAIAMAGTLFSAILSGMTSGKTPDQIAATVRSHLVAGTSKKAMGGTCKTGSREKYVGPYFAPAAVSAGPRSGAGVAFGAAASGASAATRMRRGSGVFFIRRCGATTFQIPSHRPSCCCRIFQSPRPCAARWGMKRFASAALFTRSVLAMRCWPCLKPPPATRIGRFCVECALALLRLLPKRIAVLRRSG